MNTRAGQEGINIIGHLGSSSGLGNTARLFASALQKNGYGVAGFNLDYGGTAEQHEALCFPIYKSVPDLPYSNNLLIPSINQLSSIWLRKAPELLNSRFRNAGLIFWELPVIPKAWLSSLKLFDVLLTSSHYVQASLEQALPDIPCIHAEHPLLISPTNTSSTSTREELGIATGSFVCFSNFDLRSDPARKNPFAAISAFQKAFQTNKDAVLLLKTSPFADLSRSASGNTIKNALLSDKRILTVSKTMEYSKVQELYRCADVFISLHRAEGLGLGPMEAMIQGIPAICTGYSGNMEYMNSGNSYPVPYRLIRPAGVSWQYSPAFAGSGAFWADADIDEAARILRHTKTNAEDRACKGLRGQRDMLERQEHAWKAPYAELMLRYLQESERYRNRQSLVRNALLQDVLDPTLLRLGIKSGMKKMANWFDRSTH